MENIFPASAAGNGKDGSEIVMELDQPVVLHADGEYCGDVQHICVHCMKNTLWLLHRCTEK